MSEQSLTLGPRTHDKLGSVTCGVTRDGFISVCGDPRDIGDGEEIVFDRVHITARRDGSEYTFTRQS